MTKPEAIEALNRGEKITHKYFSDNEFAFMKDGEIHLEDGVVCSPEEFWKYRTEDFFDDGWDIYLPAPVDPNMNSVKEKTEPKMKQLRFTTTKPMGMLGIFNSDADHAPLAMPENVGELIEDKIKGTGAWIHGDAQSLAKYDVPTFIDGNLGQLDLPVEEQDILMILPGRTYKCIATLNPADSKDAANKYLITLHESAKPMELTAENVSAVLTKCLFDKGEDTSGAIIVKGVRSQFGFHPGRLKENTVSIQQMINQLPNEFNKVPNGGSPFMQACMTNTGQQWGEHANIDELVCLGLATNLISWVMEDRAAWNMFPGGMPYFMINESTAD